LGVHTWTLSGCRLALLGPNWIPVRSQESELLEKIIVKHTELVIALAAHLPVIEKEKTFGIRND